MACFQYVTDKRSLFEHNIAVVTEVLLESRTENCEPYFPGCLVWPSWEPLNLELRSSGTMFGAGQRRS